MFRKRDLEEEYQSIISIIENNVNSVKLSGQVIIDAIEKHIKERPDLVDSGKGYKIIEKADKSLLSIELDFINKIVSSDDDLCIDYRSLHGLKIYSISEKIKSHCYSPIFTFTQDKDSTIYKRYNRAENTLEVGKDKVIAQTLNTKRPIDIGKNDITHYKRVVEYIPSSGEVAIYDTPYDFYFMQTYKENKMPYIPYKLQYTCHNREIEKSMVVKQRCDLDLYHNGIKTDMFGRVLRRVEKEYIEKPICKDFWQV